MSKVKQAVPMGLKNVHTEEVTPGLVKRFYTMPPFPGDRKLSKSRLRFLHKQFSKGEIHEFNWAVAHLDGKEYRLNGKHSSHVLTDDPTIIERYKCIAVISDYYPTTMGGMATAYNNIDSSECRRTSPELINSVASVNPDFCDCPTTLLSACVAGIAYAKFGRNYYGSVNAHERPEFLDSEFVFSQFAVKMDRKVRGTKRQLIRKKPVMATLFLSWDKSRTDSEKFWSRVVTGVGTEDESPERCLREFLLAHNISHRKVDSKGVEDETVFFLTCVAAWNYFRTGEKCKGGKIKYDKKNLSPTIL